MWWFPNPYFCAYVDLGPLLEWPKKRLKRGFYSYFCYLWLFCHELTLRNLVISRVLATFVQSSLCLGCLGRPGLCPKMLKTRVLQIFCRSVLQCGHLWREDLVISRVLATLSKMVFAWTGLEGLVSSQVCSKNPNLADILQ